jgi:type IV secretory pathway VirB10-like protein
MASAPVVFIGGAATVAVSLAVGVFAGALMTEREPEEKVNSLAFERNTRPDVQTVASVQGKATVVPQAAAATPAESSDELPVPDFASAFVVITPPAQPLPGVTPAPVDTSTTTTAAAPSDDPGERVAQEKFEKSKGRMDQQETSGKEAAAEKKSRKQASTAPEPSTRDAAIEKRSANADRNKDRNGIERRRQHEAVHRKRGVEYEEEDEPEEVVSPAPERRSNPETLFGLFRF